MTMPRRRTAAVAAAASAALAGCSFAPHYVRPTPPVPAAFPTGGAYQAPSAGSATPTVAYTAIFTDPRLQALIVAALANNRDLRVAYANLAAARAQVRVVRANQFPELSVTATATYNHVGANSTTTSTTRSGDYASYLLQGGVSAFEADLFGRLANATAAQRERALSSEAAARTVRLTLVADLADAWAQYAADRDLLAIAQATVVSAARSVAITDARLKGGIAPRTDLGQAQQVLTVAQGDVAAQTAALAQDVDAVRLLLGAEPDPALLPHGLGEVLAGVGTMPAGTSSAVLLGRPDVAEAEHDLIAADADIGVARAELFPTISLTGLAGFASQALGSLFTGGGFRYSAGGSANWSVFNAGGRIANVRVSEAQRDAALATYEKAIQTAFRDVADALADAGTLGERLRAAAADTAAAADVATLTDARYRFGVDNYLSVLDAQRTLYSARRSEVADRLLAAQNRVTLYRVLGGDQIEATTPQTAAAR